MKMAVKRERHPSTAAVTRPELKQSVSPASAEGESVISADERRLMICEAAYYRAEHRGFEPGHELEDWIAAEAEIERLLPTPAAPVSDAFR